MGLRVDPLLSVTFKTLCAMNAGVLDVWLGLEQFLCVASEAQDSLRTGAIMIEGSMLTVSSTQNLVGSCICEGRCAITMG